MHQWSILGMDITPFVRWMALSIATGGITFLALVWADYIALARHKGVHEKVVCTYEGNTRPQARSQNHIYPTCSQVVCTVVLSK